MARSVLAKELRESLRGNGSLHHDLLLGYLELVEDTPLHIRFPPPTVDCPRLGVLV